MKQYALDMILPVTYTAEQFILSESNKLAHEWITRWPDWPGNSLYLQGEQGAGKTHLAHLWQQKAQAVFLVRDQEALPTQAAIIDSIETWNNEQALFHIYNHCKSENTPLLITSAKLPNELPFTLPDLNSRLRSITVAIISAPDDALLEAVLIKHMSDRQLKISSEVLAYMLPRLPRSFKELAALVEKLDDESLGAGRALTIPFVRNYL